MGQKEKEELGRRFKELVEKNLPPDSDESIHLGMDMLREGTQDLELSISERNSDKINVDTLVILHAVVAIRMSCGLTDILKEMK